MTKNEQATGGWDVFISYSHQDRAHAEDLAARLQDRNLRVWWDRELESKNPESWRDEIARTILSSRYVLVLLTASSVQSLEVQREAQFAEQWGLRGPEAIITVRIGTVRPLLHRAGLLLQLASNQHFWSESDRIEPGNVEQIVTCLNEDEARGHRLDLDRGLSRFPAIDLATVEVPDFNVGDDDLALVGAVRDVGSKWVRSGRVDRLAKALDEMRRFDLLPKALASLERHGRWVDVLSWYERDVVPGAADWRGILESIEGLGREHERPARELLEACPEARERLANALNRDLLSLLRATHDGFHELATMAGRDLDEERFGGWFERRAGLLAGDLLVPLAEAVGLPLQAGDTEEPPLVVEAIREGLWDLFRIKKPGEITNPFAVELPPSAEDRESFEVRIRRQALKERVCRYLGRVARVLTVDADAEPESGWLDDLRCRLESVGRIGDAHPDPRASERLDAWTAGLDAIAGCVADPVQSPAEAIERLEEAGVAFPRAREHALLARRWRDAGRALEEMDAPSSRSQWRELGSSVAELERVSRALADRLGPHLQGLADPTRERIERRLAALAAAQGRVRTLEPLADLEIPTRVDVPEGGVGPSTDVRPLLEACRALRDLLREGASPLDENGTPRHDLEPAWFAGGREIIDRLDDAVRRVDDRLRPIRIPGLETLGLDALPAVAAVHRSIRRLRDSIDLLSGVAALLTDESSRSVEALARRMADANRELPVLSSLADLAAEFAAAHEGETWSEEAARGRRDAAADALDVFLDALRRFARALEPVLPPEDRGGLRRLVGEREAERERILDRASWHAAWRSAAAALHGGDLDGALAALPEDEDAETAVPEIRTWRGIVHGLLELREELDDDFELTLGVELNRRTGLPPSIQALAEEGHRIARLETIVQEVRYDLGAATRTSDVACELAPLERLAESVARSQETLRELERYRATLDACQDRLAGGSWSEAIREIQALCETPETSAHVDECAFRVLAALESGCEIAAQCAAQDSRYLLGFLRTRDLSHPLLAPFRERQEELLREVEEPVRTRCARAVRALRTLRTLRTLPVAPETGSPPSLLEALLGHPRIEDEKALRALARAALEAAPEDLSRVEDMQRWLDSLMSDAGPDAGAVRAMIGEPATLLDAWSPWQDLHNIAVATHARLREGATDVPANAIGVLLGHCALIAGGETYGQTLAGRLPDGAPDPGTHQIENRLSSELEELLGPAAWGEMARPDSWYAAWRIECCAVRAMRVHPTAAEQLPHPVGPTLGRALGQQPLLTELLRSLPEIRSWFGPLGRAQALQWLGQTENALEAVRESVGAESDYPFTARGRASAARTLTFDLLTQRLSAFRLSGEPGPESSTEASETFAVTIGECLAMLDELEDPVRAATRLWSCLLKRFREMERDLEQPRERLGGAATLADADARKACMDRALERLDDHPPAADPALREELAKGILALRIRRADFHYDYGLLALEDLKRRLDRDVIDEAEGEEELRRLIRLAQEIGADAPKAQYAALLVAQLRTFHVLRFETEAISRESVIEALDGMARRGHALQWSADVIEEFQDLRTRLADPRPDDDGSPTLPRRQARGA